MMSKIYSLFYKTFLKDGYQTFDFRSITMAATNVIPPIEDGITEEERPGSADSWQSWKTYNFEWLYDPNRFDHLPIDEQLKLYKHRDLKQTKIYKFAAQIWGAPQSRKRKIVAPPMNANWDDITAVNIRPQPINSELKPQNNKKKVQPNNSCFQWV